MECPYGGECIDPGYPSDCMLNSHCMDFKSEAEKAEFDALPDRYQLEKDGQIVKFKNRTQIKFFSN